MDDTKPVSDPSDLTTERLQREIGLLENELSRRLGAASEYGKVANELVREHADANYRVLGQRLDGIDEATKVLNDIVTRVPTDVQVAVGHLKELHDERFESVATQFKERDTRSERESRDNKVAVDAAFAAQKEAASEQNKSNTLAISKSEAATSETISKLTELFQTTVSAQADKVDDLKQRVTAVEQRKLGANESNAGYQWVVMAVFAGFVALASITTLIIYISSHH